MHQKLVGAVSGHKGVLFCPNISSDYNCFLLKYKYPRTIKQNMLCVIKGDAVAENALTKVYLQGSFSMNLQRIRREPKGYICFSKSRSSGICGGESG